MEWCACTMSTMVSLISCLALLGLGDERDMMDSHRVVGLPDGTDDRHGMGYADIFPEDGSTV
jgi:hypothetical protein